MGAVFVGVAVAKYRASRSPHAQGFMEVDQVNNKNFVSSRLFIYLKSFSFTDNGSSRHARRATRSKYANKRI